ERANAAAKNVLTLEAALARAQVPEAETADVAVSLDDPIVLEAVGFHYESQGDEPGFTIGPISMSIDPGRILFLVGGNGSGKSTLLKVVTGLYHPDSGTIRIGSTRLTRATAMWFRSHFTAIFSEYHLFDRLYGLERVPAERVQSELARMQLERKV